MRRTKSILSGAAVGIAQLCLCASLLLAMAPAAKAHGPYEYEIFLNSTDCSGPSITVYDASDWLTFYQNGIGRSYWVNGHTCAVMR